MEARYPSRPPNFVNSATAASATAATFTRERTSTPDPAASLTPDQQALDQRLRDWRKSESERIGLPQFFILGSSTLRSIVLKHPRSRAELERIDGINQEKADQFGASILQLCELG